MEQTATTAEATEQTEDNDFDSVKVEWVECPPPQTFPATTRRGRKILIIASLLAAFVLGTIWHFAGTFLDLVFLTPLAAGIGLAFVMEKAVSRAHWRRPQTVIWLSIAAALLIFTTRYVEDCVSVRSDLVHMLTDHYAKRWHMPADAAQSYVEQGLTPFGTFRLFMILTAYQGVYLSRDMGVTYLMSSGTMVSSIGIPFRGYGFWFLLLLQGTVISWVCVTAAGGTARAGYCETCGNWATRHRLFRKQGHQSDELSDCIRNQEWARADNIRLGCKINNKDFSTAYLLRCEHCAEDRIVVNRTTQGEETYLFHATITPEAASTIRTAVRRLI